MDDEQKDIIIAAVARFTRDPVVAASVVAVIPDDHRMSDLFSEYDDGMIPEDVTKARDYLLQLLEVINE